MGYNTVEQNMKDAKRYRYIRDNLGLQIVENPRIVKGEDVDVNVDQLIESEKKNEPNRTI